MKNLKKKVRIRIHLKSKHLLAIMTIFCASCIVATFASGVTTVPLQEAAGMIIVPFENSINHISSVFKGISDRMKDKEEILAENERLQSQVDSLTEQNNKLIQDQTELVRLEQLYNRQATGIKGIIWIGSISHFSNYAPTSQYSRRSSPSSDSRWYPYQRQ